MSVKEKIESFFEHGIVAGMDVAASFDEARRGAVSLNCISEEKGVHVSLFHEAKGGLTVAVEEAIGSGGILDAALERNHKAIQDAMATMAAKIPLAMSADFFLAPARAEVLREDQEFLSALSDKMHRTALFVLDLEVLPGENESIDGSKEASRASVSKECLKAVFFSDRFEDEMVGMDARCVSVPTCKIDIGFSYKDEKGHPQFIENLASMEVPSYHSALLECAQDRNLKNTPLYTHMTRV